MARYEYDLPYRSGRRYGRRAPRYAPGPAYGEEFRIRSRMGMHDFAEHYGRYSGGSIYDYEYSERTIEHTHPRPEHEIGFTRPLREAARRRPPAHRRRRRPPGR